MAKSELHRKIFYHPDTLKIIGMSDGDQSLAKFPYLEVEAPYHATNNLKIGKDKDGKLKVEHKHNKLQISEKVKEKKVK